MENPVRVLVASGERLVKNEIIKKSSTKKVKMNQDLQM